MRGRPSGIPTPGRSAIPTPGRSRSTSTTQHVDVAKSDADTMSRAFADAIKANDPAQHRVTRVSDVSSSSLSPLAVSHSYSGRPSSVASTSSASSQPRRPKTPVSARPPSRASDVFTRSSSRAGNRSFEVGDNVRIESLGFEGTLRYIGEIDGKSGLWAGVELSPGFAGKGKNNGSVAGKVYFTCPDKCGVFVATTKLSPPTVGPGAVHRPSSVASSRSGRITPSFSGRITPSTSLRNVRATPAISGRVTPSANRVTPSVDTPAARAARLRALAQSSNATTPTAAKTASLADKITSGSRASKYVSMTAKQLSTMNGTDTTPLHTSVQHQSSPTRVTRGLSSPSRSTSSPYSTPKPRISASGMGTPRGRVPSAIQMPPPPSPSHKAEDDQIFSTSELSQRGKTLQDKILSLTSGKPSTPTTTSSWATSSSPHRPGSSASTRSSVGAIDHIDQLQSRIEALEYENERLRSSVSAPPTPAADPELPSKLESLESSNASANMEISQLKTTVSTAEATISEQDSQIKSLTVSKEAVESDLQELQTSVQLKIKELIGVKEHLAASEEMIKSLQDVISEKSSAEDMNGKLLVTKSKEWEASEARLKKLIVDLEEEKRDLSGLVDELRHAGQETIALYEERLRASDAQRYELEDRIVDLEAKTSTTGTSSLETPNVPSAPTTTQIDNETLREQVLHLQRKVSTLEDIIEDSRATAEREEVAMRERMRKVKDREDALKKELNDGKREVERVLKSEAAARGRIEEVQEALRESTVALENAQAEVEGLRSELDNLNALVASNANGDHTEIIRSLESQNLSFKRRVEDQESELLLARQQLDEQAGEVEYLRKKATNGVSSPAVSKHELSTAREENTGLKHIVQELQKESVSLTQQNKLLESENQLLRSEMEQLRQEVKILEENFESSILHEEQDLNDNKGDDSMRQLLKELKGEVEQLRKKLADAEMKTARTAHDLNKEISELEALVESKIYREDELEQEIERLKDRLARQKKSSKGSVETVDSHQRTRASSNVTSHSDSGEPVCEICERPGHDIFSCDLLKEESSSAVSQSPSDLFCEECEEHGHVAAECPHSLDVF